MAEDRQVCPECKMEFDWPGVAANGLTYCCDACSLGEPCTCEQHDHATLESDLPLPRAMANQLGIETPGEVRQWEAERI